MKKLLFLSVLISLVTTFDTQCMLARFAQQGHSRARLVMLQQRRCTTNINDQYAIQRIRTLETVVGVHTQQIAHLNKEIDALTKALHKNSNHRDSLCSSDYNIRSHKHDSYLPDYNMHYRSGQDHKQ